MYEFETAYRAMASRDRRFDGRFVVAVTSTRVYCRPSCPSRTPKRENVRFYRLPAAAEAAGFRACRRCRPDVEPSSPEWNVRGDLVARALRLINGGFVDQEGVAGLSRRLAVSDRHLHRQLVAEVGVGAQQLAINRRAQVARLLIESSALPLTEIAFAAGYASIRQFNEGMRAAFGCSPGELRKRPAGARAALGSSPGRLRRTPAGTEASFSYPPGELRTAPHGARGAFGSSAGGLRKVPAGARAASGRLSDESRSAPAADGELVVRLRYRPPLAVRPLLDWLAARALPGLGVVEGDNYLRALRLPHGIGHIHAAFDQPGAVTVRLSLADLRDVAAAVQRCREIFDLDADPGMIADDLGGDPLLGPMVRARPGLRVPGCADGFEFAVQAIAGRRLGLAVVDKFGASGLFPTPQALADADIAGNGPLRTLARAVAAGDITLDRGADRDDCVRRLRALPGVDAATAARIARHALGDPDAALGTRADEERWRPWRSYAAMYLGTDRDR